MVAAAFAACGGIGDESYTPPEREPLNQVDLANAPWCIGTCLPDYGSQQIDCSAEAGVEFFPIDVMNPAPNGTVTDFYQYNDRTNEFLVSGPLGYDPNTLPMNFAPPAVEVNDRCGPDGELGTEWVHHFRGGLFREWGGGIGRRLLNFATGCSYPAAEGDPGYCVEADPRIEAAAENLPEAEAQQLRTDFYGMMVDLRGWDGISFWARGGPNNTAGIRVYVGDRQLDEDIAFVEARAGIEPMCGRIRECGCRNHRPCTLNDLDRGGAHPGYSCWQPGLDPSPAEVLAATGRTEAIFEDFPYYACGITACNEGNPSFANGLVETEAADPLFATAEHPTYEGTAQCLPYKLVNDLEDFFCYTPGDPAQVPPDAPELCGDGWAKGVALTTDWQFYKVPFSELRQEGYGKLFGNLDLSKITLVRFTWMQGWVDVWLDDVRFYRNIPQ